ncbi:unnamed protein product [Dibothriocephalus latus]|uniref:Uncharacterized protein n=1 Tax=Dibothriocephalus latus TaxID=60516 RepID=A0A3P7LVN4_DIBLA|nr:unnamed protein product [Dibothriocephalus latus]
MCDPNKTICARLLGEANLNVSPSAEHGYYLGPGFKELGLVTVEDNMVQDDAHFEAQFNISDACLAVYTNSPISQSVQILLVCTSEETAILLNGPLDNEPVSINFAVWADGGKNITLEIYPGADPVTTLREALHLSATYN